MPSKEHQALQLAIVASIYWDYSVLNNSNIMSLCVDNHLELDPPQKIEDYRPDVYFASPFSSMCIIGEAKTSSDLDNDHTKKQLQAYVKHLKKFTARSKKNNLGVLILAAPLASQKDALQILEKIGGIYHHSSANYSAMKVKRCLKNNVIFSNDTDLFENFSKVSLVSAQITR